MSRRVAVSLKSSSPTSSLDNVLYDTGTTDVDSFADTLGKGCVWDYTLWKDGNVRTGRVYSAWDASGNTVVGEDEHTSDVGDTSGVTLGVVISDDTVKLQATAASDGWSIATNRTLLGG